MPPGISPKSCSGSRSRSRLTTPDLRCEAAPRTFRDRHGPDETVAEHRYGRLEHFGSPAPNSDIARALAAAIPPEVSKSPLLGILGVIMGAGIVTLAGRMISLGAADLKGHVGISFDDGAWIDSAFNASLMFIGPFTVYLGGLLGPRRVLLMAATFTLICAFLPLVHSYNLLIVGLVLPA
jgi:hypothetical protein